MLTRSRTILRFQRTLRMGLVVAVLGALAALFQAVVLEQVGLDAAFVPTLLRFAGSGAAAGLVFALVHLFVLRPRLRQFAFLSAWGVVSILLLVVFLVVAWRTELPVGSYAFVGRYVFGVLVAGVLMMAVRISDQYGSGGIALLFGRYSTPREEQRIFLFFDMRSSTSIAEQLGHKKYFSLLNDVYADITDPVIDTRGEVYQYVGDEVSVTWRMQRGLKEQRCLECFFRIREKLQQREAYYRATYGLLPEFKAGLHCGAVTTGEVGLVKKEPIFSGDAVNTAARIQNSCNRLGVDILLSQDLMDHLRLPEGRYQRRPMGEISLQGKRNAVALWTIDKVDNKASATAR
ncbi:MAG: adenylate/guanylate cyclase domain-containing protein [Flavobacteriales bacterium]|nr:MAG: adenylate/guanylate cyclase domain-containing protein [Flavobacteriales bacterium]